MEEICLLCGSKGYDNAFVYCIRCLNIPIHRYCLDVLPETLDEFVPWVCDFCEDEARKSNHRIIWNSSMVFKSGKKSSDSVVVLRPEDLVCKDDSQESPDESSLMQIGGRKDDKAIFSEADAPLSFQPSSSHELREVRAIDNYGSLGCNSTFGLESRKNESFEKRGQAGISSIPIVLDSNHGMSELPDVFYNESLSCSKKKKTISPSEVILVEKTCRISHDQLFEESQCLSIENHLDDKIIEGRSPMPDSKLNKNGQSANKEETRHAVTEPVSIPIWRGSFSICNREDGLIDGLTAHVSNKACQKVHDAACKFQPLLQLEFLPKTDVWTKCFGRSEPSGDDISLFFFPSKLSARAIRSLIGEMRRKDLALKASWDDAELLIFTSLELPVRYLRFHGELYVWGVFIGHEAAISHLSGHDIQSSNPSCKTNSHGAKADRRGSHLDGAWEHARTRTVDARHKVECKHCGFFSSYGGISRLKAHLGGGDPRIRLLGCPRVPPEVKKVMAEWFFHWVKTSKAHWTKEIREAEVLVDTRGRSQGEYGKASDAAENQETYFKNIDFTSLHSDTSQYKVKFREDPKSDVEAMLKASPETGVVRVYQRRRRKKGKEVGL